MLTIEVKGGCLKKRATVLERGFDDSAPQQIEVTKMDTTQAPNEKVGSLQNPGQVWQQCLQGDTS